jgi:DNA-binding response OmpR family regulator
MEKEKNSAGAMKRKKILIIEDEVTLQKAMTDFLTQEKFEVVSALDGEQGLALAKSEMPDLIILDIILPKKDGYEVLLEIKKDSHVKKIPVILLTNLESMENVQKAFESGATTYLVKSDYKLEEVVRKIKETLKM